MNALVYETEDRRQNSSGTPIVAQDGTRPLYRPGRERAPDGNAIPTGSSRAAIDTRHAFADFLGANLPRPVHFTESQQQEKIEEGLRTMMLAERIMIELEMTERFRTAYSADYDPLRY